MTPSHPPADPARAPDPARGLRGVGAGLLVLEAIVVLLALPTLATLGHSPTGPALAVIVVIALGLVVTAGTLRRPRATAAGSVLQVLVIAAGLLSWPLFVLGMAFGALWIGYLRMMRDLRSHG